MKAEHEPIRSEAKPKFERLIRIEIEPSENGGHTVTHHLRPKMTKSRDAHSGMAMGYQEPEKHVFGADEGHEMLAHVANHLGIPEGKLGAEENDEVDNEDGVGEEA